MSIASSSKHINFDLRNKETALLLSVAQVDRHHPKFISDLSPYLLFIQNYAVEHCGTRHNGLHNIGSPDQLFINNIIYHLQCHTFTSPIHQNPSISTIHFRMVLYLVTCFLRATVSLLCRLQAVSKIHVPIYSYI